MKPLAPILVSGAVFLAGGPCWSPGRFRPASPAQPTPDHRAPAADRDRPCPRFAGRHCAALPGARADPPGGGRLARRRHHPHRGHRRHCACAVPTGASPWLVRCAGRAGPEQAGIPARGEPARHRLFAVAAGRHSRRAGGVGVDRVLRLPFRRLWPGSMDHLRLCRGNVALPFARPVWRWSRPSQSVFSVSIGRAALGSSRPRRSTSPACWPRASRPKQGLPCCPGRPCSQAIWAPPPWWWRGPAPRRSRSVIRSALLGGHRNCSGFSANGPSRSVCGR